MSATQTTCSNSGRIVTATARKRAVYVGEQWITCCPKCGQAAPFQLAEVKADNSSYARRYLTHGE